MENPSANGSKNGAKPRRKKLTDSETYTEAEMELIKSSRAVMKIIQKRKDAGEFDEFLKEEHSKV